MDKDEHRIPVEVPYLDHDELIGEIEARNREDASRALLSGTTREHIKEFLQLSGMNAQAFSICRSILKKPDTQKAMDVILSLEAALPMVKAHVSGQAPELPFDTPVEPIPDAVPETMKRPSYDAEFDPHEDMDAEEKYGEPSAAEERQIQNEAADELEADEDDFLAAAAE